VGWRGSCGEPEDEAAKLVGAVRLGEDGVNGLALGLLVADAGAPPGGEHESGVWPALGDLLGELPAVHAWSHAEV
jgi:hypothetical protein